MNKIYTLLLVLFSLQGQAQTETEPNNNFETANLVTAGSTVSGSINNTDDDYDYYKTVLPTDGTLKIYVKGTNTSAAGGWLNMYGFDRRKASGTVFNEYIKSSNTPAGTTIYDTITAYGRAADTFYFRINSSRAFSYSFSYEMVDTSTNDVEPNNTFDEALSIDHQQEKQGHIGYLYNGTSDGDDFYKTVLPTDGTLKIYVKGTNTSAAGGWLHMYGYDRRKASGTVFGEYINSSNTAAGATIYDTITVYGRAADTFYFRIHSSKAFSYSFSYEMVDTSTNDVEPNNTFETALLINNTEQKAGHIGYLQNGSSDANDYYKTLLPFDGAIKIIIEGVNKGGAGGYLYLNGYDKRKASGTIFGTYISGSSIPHNQIIHDTIIVNGQLSDSFFLRVTSSRSFQYKISYQMIEDSPFDEEPNNTFDQAVFINNGISKTGQIGYTAGGVTDANDYYKTVLPADGTLKIYVKGTNTSASAGYLYMYGYDRRKASGTVFGEYINSSNTAAGATIYDTITAYGRAADTFYFRINSTRAFSYSFSYEMADTSTNDVEPNNTFDDALSIDHQQEKQGHIGYLYNGTSDGDDFYKTVLPTDGTLKIYVKGTNTSGAGGWLHMYGYDRRKASGTVFNEYIKSSNTPAGTTIYDTITAYGRAADTFYFRINSTRAFSYSFSYEMVDTSTNDVEPNNTFDDALSIDHQQEKQGHIGYLYNGTSDGDDFYKTVLPTDGTLKIYVKGTNTSAAGGWLNMYGFDRRKASGTVFGEYINSSNTAAGATIYDTITAYGRAADTFYFRINSTRAFSYSVSYEMVDTSNNDVEPNNTFDEAVTINAQEKLQGHIGYLYNGTSDQNDYYKTVLPKNGTIKILVKGKNTSGKASYLYLYAYDSRKASGTILSAYISGSSNIKADSTIYDTLLIQCRSIDSVYFRVISSGAFAYELSYDMDGNTDTDSEPNNNFETADAFKTDSLFTGRVGYYKAGVADANDYYKMVLPQKGHAKFNVTATNTSNGNGRIQMLLYDRNKRLIGTQVITANNSVPAGAVITDTLLFECLTTDTLYVVINSNTCFTYEFSMEHQNMEPNADMTYERLGNTFGFRPQLSNADSFLWNFGDTTTSTSPYPMKTYLPGNYTTRLIAQNATCNFTDTAFQAFVIKGVEYYTPLKGGSGGDVSMSFFGGGLEAGTIVKLTQGDQVLSPVDIFTNSELNHFTAIFDIHLVEPGEYDVTVEIPGEDMISYPGGFSIEQFSYPTTWSEIKGPDRWRTNLETKFSLIVGNNGNVMASGVVVALLWPKEVTIEFENDFYRPPTTGVETVVVDGETFSLPRSEYSFIYDSLQTITPIDTFNLKPYNGYIRYLLIPHVPAGTTVEFPFFAKSTSTGAASFKTYTFKTNQRGSCENPVYTNYNEDVTAELIDVLDMGIDQYGPPPLKVLSKTAKIGQKHAGSASSYMGKKFWAWYDGYEFDGDAAMADLLHETEANNAFALQTATDELGGFLFDKGTTKILDKYQGQVDFINKRLANNPNMSAELTGKYLDKLNSLPHNEMKRLEALKSIFKTTKDLGTLSDKLVKLQQLSDECPELQKQIDDLLKDLEKELNIRDPKDKETNRVTSMDPNEISGPSGIGANRYVNNLDAHSFYISFENVDTAGAAAQIVVVRDTLDKSKYDLSTFEFGNITIAKKTHRLPKGRSQFVIERRIQQDLPLKVRINGSLDTLTGVVEWQFTSLDTNTNRLPVLEGFLPPNVTMPEGEGSVSFTVKPLNTLNDGTIFRNQATIIFDQNEPILTNIWQNILDTGKPNSSLTARVSEDSLIHLNLSGFDGVSGVGYYHVNVSVNNGEWISFTGTSSDTMTLSGQMDSTYHFYIISQDKVGNLEDKMAGAEVSVTLSNTLNITMGMITATNVGEKNEVNWNTFAEETGDYFVLERSSDGVHFSGIATIPATGHASDYRHTDEKPVPGKNYYRLKLYNVEGKYTYSRTVSAVVSNADLFAIEVFPNPVSNLIKIKVYGTNNVKAKLTLTSVQGNVLYETISSTSQTEIDVSKFAKGIYFIKYQDDQQQRTLKIVKE